MIGSSIFKNFQILDSSDIKELRTIKEISSGACGKIVEVGKEEKYALKVMHTGDFTIKDIKGFIREYEILCMLKHPNIVQAYGIFLSDDQTQPSILLELCPTNLNNAIKNSNPTELNIITWIYQIAEAMKYVHECKIIHRDLKPTNILIGKDNLIRVTDFGISKLMSSEEQSTTLGIGTQKFMAPEILREEEYDEKIDVYSFGVIVYFMLSKGEMPKINIIQVGNGTKAKIPSNFTPFASKLIDSCWNFNPKDRPSFSDILSLLEENDYKLFDLNKSQINEIKKIVKNHQKLIDQIKGVKETNEQKSAKANADNDGTPKEFTEAIEKFEGNKVFAFLCSLIIQNAGNLITNPQSEILCKNFNYNSDLVTILETLFEFIQKEIEKNDDSGKDDDSDKDDDSEKKDKLERVDDYGLNIFVINSIYSQIESKFGSKNGSESVSSAIKWAKEQENQLHGAVCSFVNCLDKKEFIDDRRCEFQYVRNANAESVPSLVYKTKKGELIDVYRRPGCKGLQSPGSVIVLSLTKVCDRKQKYGMIVHNDQASGNNNQGVSTIEIFNNMFFFILFEQYVPSDFMTKENFVEIYQTPNLDEKKALMIYINNVDDKSFLSFCPRNSDADRKIHELVKSVNSLVPFVPRSILVRFDDKKCAVEIVGYGALHNYTTSLYFDSSSSEAAIAYPINKETIQFALDNVDALKKDMPFLKFALTGENFMCTDDENDEFSYPDVSPSINCVFDPDHPSHLVLLVDKNYATKPKGVEPLSWIFKKQKNIKKLCRFKWNFDFSSIPQIKYGINLDEDSTCQFLCSLPRVPPPIQPIFVYGEDGTVKSLAICAECFVQCLSCSDVIQSVVDPLTKKIDFAKLNKLDESPEGFALVYDDKKIDATWPQIPLGLALYTLMSESDTSIYAKIWFTAAAYSIRSKTRMFTHCPSHPNKLICIPKDGKNVKCEHCDMLYCSKCRSWHKSSDKCSNTNDVKRCPSCNTPTIKVGGTNHITCPCGKHWCYKCDKSPIFNTVGECYSHLKKVHGEFYT